MEWVMLAVLLFLTVQVIFNIAVVVTLINVMRMMANETSKAD